MIKIKLVNNDLPITTVKNEENWKLSDDFFGDLETRLNKAK